MRRFWRKEWHRMILVRGFNGMHFRGSETCVYDMGECPFLEDGVYGGSVRRYKVRSRVSKDRRILGQALKLFLNSIPTLFSGTIVFPQRL